MRSIQRVLGYARVSSVGQAVGTSLADQQAVIRAHASSRGLTVEPGHMFVESESAVHEKIERREQVRALLETARTGDLVLVDKVDRWSRDPEFTYRSVRELLAKGVQVYFVGDQCDPSTPEGDTQLGFRVLYAREELKRIRVRTVGTRNLLRDRGYFAVGTPPVGYRRQDVKGVEKNVLVVDEEGAELVRRVFALSIAGRSGAEIAEELEQHRDWVFDTLRNRHYLGEQRNSKGEWIKGRHQPIVDARTFVEAGEALGSRKYTGKRPPSEGAETSSWWLRELTYCALCGAKMTSSYGGRDPKRPRRYYFLCRKRCTTRLVRVDETERKADPMVLQRLLELRDELARAVDESEPRASDAADLAERRERLARRRSRLLELYADGGMTREELAAATEKLDAERTKLDAREQKAAPVTTGQRRSALATIDTMVSAWSKANPPERRVVVAGLARTVRLAFDREPSFEWFTSEEIARRGKG